MFCKQVSQINRLHLCSVFKYLKLTYYTYFRPAFNIFFIVINYEVNISMLLSIKESSLTCLSFNDYFLMKWSHHGFRQKPSCLDTDTFHSPPSVDTTIFLIEEETY